METRQLIRSIAHRNIRSLAVELSASERIDVNSRYGVQDEWLYRYTARDDAAERETTVYVGTASLLLVEEDGEWMNAKYSKMQAVSIEAKTKLANTLSITLRNGSIVNVPMMCRGQFSDAWRFYQFLSKIVEREVVE